MKNILVLVDFTETADIAVKQALQFAQRDSAAITFCHIAQSKDDGSEALIKELQPYGDQAQSLGLDYNIMIGHGDLFDEVEAIVSKVGPDLIVVGTHGKHGIKQNLFGSAIHKLVRHIPAPSLVVNDHTRVIEGGYKKVMMPVAPHEDYLVKVEQTIDLMAPDGEIVIFAILKPGVPLDEEILRNIEATKKLLEERGVKYSYQEEDSDRYSIGYSKETLAHVRN
ncbi:MAG: universal stress protein, partial [Flavobacteriales bacterium]|nr:universal stress protein [Flavobacteriales bacterium]